MPRTVSSVITITTAHGGVVSSNTQVPKAETTGKHAKGGSMERGKIILRPGSDRAPWDLVLEGDAGELAGATFTLEPADDGRYRMLVSGPDVQAHGLQPNHIQTVLS